MDPQVTEPQPSFPAPRRRFTRIVKIIVVIFAVLVAIGLVAIAAYEFIPSVRADTNRAMQIAALEKDLPGATFVGIVGSGHTVKYYHFVWFSLVPYTPTQKSVSSTATQLYVARADASSTPTGVIPPSDLPAGWEIFSKAPNASSSPKYIGTGFAPVMLDAKHVGYFGINGYSVRDLTAGPVTVLSTSTVSTSIIPQAYYSPDHTHVLWSDTARNLTFLATVSTSTFRVDHTYSNIAGVLLTNSAFYTLGKTSAGTELWKIPYNGQQVRKLFTFPQALTIVGIFI